MRWGLAPVDISRLVWDNWHRRLVSLTIRQRDFLFRQKQKKPPPSLLQDSAGTPTDGFLLAEESPCLTSFIRSVWNSHEPSPASWQTAFRCYTSLPAQITQRALIGSHAGCCSLSRRLSSCVFPPAACHHLTPLSGSSRRGLRVTPPTPPPSFHPSVLTGMIEANISTKGVYMCFSERPHLKAPRTVCRSSLFLFLASLWEFFRKKKIFLWLFLGGVKLGFAYRKCQIVGWKSQKSQKLVLTCFSVPEDNLEGLF